MYYGYATVIKTTHFTRKALWDIKENESDAVGISICFVFLVFALFTF